MQKRLSTATRMFLPVGDLGQQTDVGDLGQRLEASRKEEPGFWADGRLHAAASVCGTKVVAMPAQVRMALAVPSRRTGRWTRRCGRRPEVGHDRGHDGRHAAGEGDTVPGPSRAARRSSNIVTVGLKKRA